LLARSALQNDIPGSGYCIAGAHRHNEFGSPTLYWQHTGSGEQGAKERTMTDRFELPPDMKAFAEKSVEQARQAFDGFVTAANRAVSTLEGQTETARQGAKDVTEKAMTFAQKNIASSFEFVQKLVQAKDFQEVLKLQTDYVKTQMQVLTEQAKELGESTAKATKDATTPRQ
jgi:phasin